MEVLKVALERETEGDEIELSLELSIGGCYGKSISTKKMEEKNEENDENVPRSVFSCSNVRDLERKRKTIVPQDLKEQESCVLEREDELIPESQKFQAKAEEDGEKNGISEYSAPKWENGSLHVLEKKQRDTTAVSFLSSWCYVPRVNNMVKRPKVNRSVSQTEPHHCFSKVIPEPCANVVPPHIPRPEKFEPDAESIKTNKSRSRADNQSFLPPKRTGGLVKKPPKPPTRKTIGVSIRHMPCVSTTGNGPNGKTVTGFLYKYTKTEVSIMCVCHRRYFSPSEFVEHAGGVDILNPLRHITVVNSVR
ncbi:hypothetical protein OROHE_026891 [Orobanche hederae]